jgi:hypothetical protein
MKKMTVVITKADVPNANNRIYPRAVLEDVIETVAKNSNPPRVFGTIGMPEGVDLEVSKFSHTVSNLRLNEKGQFLGDVLILETPQGEVMRKILEVDNTRSFRMAGIGKLEDNPDGTTTVVDFRLLSVNFVKDGA